MKTRILDLFIVSSFIWWLLYLFWLEFKFKEHSFRIYRGQWINSIILTKKSVLLRFHCWQSMKGKYVLLRPPRDLIARCLFKYQLFFQIWGYLFRVNRVQMNFSRSRIRNYIFVLFLMNWFKCKPFRSTLDEEFHLILLSSFTVSIQRLNSRSSHFVFIGARARFPVFLLQKYVLVFLC